MTVKAVVALLALLYGATAYKTYCRCQCDDEFTVYELGAEKTCSECSAAYCTGQGMICAGVSPEEITTQCFQRQSIGDQFVIYSFLCLIVGLLVTIVVRNYL